MSATIDCVHPAAVANSKLSSQTRHPAPSLRLVVGHSSLLSSLVPELVDLGVWSLETLPWQPRLEYQRDGPAQSKFLEDFDERSDGRAFEWNYSDSSDSDSTSSSDWSDDDGSGDDNSQPLETENVNTASQPRIPTEVNGDMREPSLLDDPIAHPRSLASMVGAGSSWMTAKLGGAPCMWRRRAANIDVDTSAGGGVLQEAVDRDLLKRCIVIPPRPLLPAAEENQGGWPSPALQVIPALGISTVSFP